jgi:SNF2 family DNA or RNA helicase
VNEKGQAVNQQSKCHNCPKELNRQWKTVIVDEIHRLKDPQAMQTRAIWALREGTGVKGVGPADLAYGLTGTPVADHPGDLWSALRFVRPNEFQSKEEFTGRYCEWGYSFDREGEGHPKIIGLHPDPQRQQEFFNIIDPIMRRMPKDAVLPQLPPRIYTTRYVQMPLKQRTAYQRMENEMVAEVDNGVVVAINPLVKLTRLGQFASAYAALVDDEVQLIEPSCKIDALMEILSDMDDKPVVVFAMHKQLIDLAVKQLDKTKITYALFTGDQSDVEKEHAKREFQAGNIRVLLATIGAGSEGHTFTRADTAIFLERSWREIDNDQARNRIHRIGSEIHRRVEYITLVAERTIDERQTAVLQLKEENLEAVVRDRRTLRIILTGEIPEELAG